MYGLPKKKSTVKLGFPKEKGGGWRWMNNSV